SAGLYRSRRLAHGPRGPPERRLQARLPAPQTRQSCQSPKVSYRPAHGKRDGLQLTHQLFELLGPQRLRPVGERAVGIGMDFDHQAVGAGGYGGPRHGSHDVAAAGGVRRGGENRQVGQVLDPRDGGEIQGIARVGFEGADAAFAENNVVIAAGQYVLGGEQEFLDAGSDAPFQQHRLGLLAELAQQVEVLHIARAHLHDVRILRQQRDLRLVDDFADYQQAVAVGGGAQHFQALGAQTLKSIRRVALLEGAAAYHPGAGAGRQLGALLDLVPVFHAARAGHDDHGVAADGQRAHAHDGAAGPKDAAGELIGRGDAMGFFDTLHDLEDGDVEIVLAADPAEHGVDHARGAVHVEFEIHQPIDHVLDLLFSGAFLHDD